MRWAVALMMLLVATASAAQPAAEKCKPTTSVPSHTLPAADGKVRYVEHDECPRCTLVYYVYEESNSMPGLQRQDVGHDDTCKGLIKPDTVALAT